MLLAKMSFQVAIHTDTGVVLDDRCFHIVRVGRDQGESFYLHFGDEFVQCQDRCCCRYSGRSGYLDTELLVLLKAEPPSRGFAPTDHIDAGVCKKRGCFYDLGVIELCQSIVL